MNKVRFFSFSGSDVAMPRCGISLASAGPMKAGRDDANRAVFFRSCGISPASVLAVAQIHSRIVHIADIADALSDRPQGDGVMTRNSALVPSVTVADCMPVYVFDPVTGSFGVLHSGWKGTGIIRTALELAADEWGAKPSDFRVVLGPHIRSCCYTVDRERADYFSASFGPSCVEEDAARASEGSPWPYRLSLAEANRNLCLSLGIRDENIADLGECTAYASEYGSNRREGADSFTHMTAFISWH